MTCTHRHRLQAFILAFLLRSHIIWRVVSSFFWKSSDYSCLKKVTSCSAFSSTLAPTIVPIIQLKPIWHNTIKSPRSFPLSFSWSIINIPISCLSRSKRLKGKRKPRELHKNANPSHLFNHRRDELKCSLELEGFYLND